MQKEIIPKSGLGIKGFFRINIEEDGKIVGDSGWIENQVTNLGIQNYVGYALLGSAGSTPTIAAVGLGSGVAPASNAVTLPGEISGSTRRNTDLTVAFSSRSTSDGSATAQFTATFASGDSFLDGSSNLSNIGLFNATTSNATLFAGNTYASSSCDTNQNVNITYQIQIG